MKKRIWIFGTFVILASLALFVTTTGAQPGTVKQIVPGVWFREGDLENQGHCNNIIIEMKDYLIVVDANFPSGARLALAAAKKVSSKPVKYVFDTHHHGDHAYGNPIWTQAGATTLAYKGVAEEMKRYEPARWQATSKGRKDVGDMHLDVPEPPKQTFDKSPFILKDDTREVRFYFFGWAHTRGDGFVYLPKEKVLLLEGELQFMTELHKAVGAAVKQGKKLTDIVPAGTKMVYGNEVPASTSITLPDNVKNWVGAFLPAQVRDTYEEISQKKPHGDLPH